MDAELKEKLLDIFELDELEDTQVLRDLDTWDSLAGLSIIALCDSRYGFTLSAAELKQLKTVADLASYIQANAKK